MTKLPPSSRWCGVALGGYLQSAAQFCFSAHGGGANMSQIAEYCRPERVHRGGKPSRWQIHDHARALRSIGAVKVRREGSQWVWRLEEK
jgi:hypothetical protein